MLFTTFNANLESSQLLNTRSVVNISVQADMFQRYWTLNVDN